MRHRPEQRDSIYAKLIGNLGATKGGYARADNLSAKQRSKIASDAAKVRWSSAQAKLSKHKP